MGKTGAVSMQLGRRWRWIVPSVDGGAAGNAGTQIFRASSVSGADLLTREAIVEYMDHLDTDGTIAIRVRDDHELWRTFNTAFQAMADAGAGVGKVDCAGNQPWLRQ